VLLAVANMADATTIETRQAFVSGGEWRAAKTLGVTQYGATILLDPSYKPAWFEIRAGAEDATPYAANVAEPWFLFGDGGSSSSPGGWVRVVGEAISITRNGGRATLKLAGGPLGSKSVEIAARASADGDGVGAKSTRWHAFFDLPSTLAPGQYTASVANDAAGTTSYYTPLCTFIDTSTPCLATLNVSAPFAWKTDVFTVNATQPGPGRDATAAVQAAIVAAAKNGGGVVYFPRGQYFVREALVVAPGTVLRGEAAELVAIYFAEANATTAPDAYVTSSVAGPWGVEHLTFFVTAFAHSIVRFQPGTDNAFMRHCRIRFDSYFCLEPQQGSSSRGRNASWDHAVGTAVTLAGRNIFVTDNDVYSSGDVVSTLNNGAAGAEYMHIARNRFWNGGTTHWGVSWKQCIYEDNRATGVSTTAMGSNYPQYSHGDGAPHVSNIAHFNNTQNMVWGNDREMMTCDGGGGVYYGGARAGAGSTRVALAAPATGAQPGGALCVLAGSGTGECRRVVSAHAAPTSDAPQALDEFDVTHPFSVALDATSMITIMPYVGHIAFNGNAYSDGGEVQFYAQALGCVAAENTFERTGGLSTWARGDPGADANLRNSFIDNEGEFARTIRAHRCCTRTSAHDRSIPSTRLRRCTCEDECSFSPPPSPPLLRAINRRHHTAPLPKLLKGTTCGTMQRARTREKILLRGRTFQAAAKPSSPGSSARSRTTKGCRQEGETSPSKAASTALL
jgi:hypothetical protein